MIYSDWYLEVVELASCCGYDEDCVYAFNQDLVEHFNNGLSPSEAFEIEF